MVVTALYVKKLQLAVKQLVVGPTNSFAVFFVLIDREGLAEQSASLACRVPREYGVILAVKQLHCSEVTWRDFALVQSFLNAQRKTCKLKKKEIKAQNRNFMLKK